MRRAAPRSTGPPRSAPGCRPGPADERPRHDHWQLPLPRPRRTGGHGRRHPGGGTSGNRTLHRDTLVDDDVKGGQGDVRRHGGIDLASPTGTEIYATADGVVGRSGWAGGYGNLVEITHGKGIQTRYGHMSKRFVEDGERVKRGQVIGLVGSTGRSTGPHLHYEVEVNGAAVEGLTASSICFCSFLISS